MTKTIISILLLTSISFYLLGAMPSKSVQPYEEVNWKKLSKYLKKSVKKHCELEPIKEALKIIGKEKSIIKLSQSLHTFLSKSWNPSIREFAFGLLEFDIPKINSVVLNEAFSSYQLIPLQYQKNTFSFTYFDPDTIRKTILISNTKGFSVLDSLCKVGNAYGGWAVPYLVNLYSQKASESILQLKNDENIYARYQVAIGMLYLNGESITKKILLENINDEVGSLSQEKPFSKSYVYAGWSIKLLHQIDRKLAKEKYDLLLGLYQKALGINPKFPHQNIYSSLLLQPDVNRKISLNHCYSNLLYLYDHKDCN